MSVEPPVRFLDITRLIGRADGGPLTGIDRVERAYLRALIGSGGDFVLATRTALGWLMVEAPAAPRILGWIDDVGSLPRPGLAGRLLSRPRRTPALESALREVAAARLLPRGLAGWLKARAPGGGSWISVGHMNLADTTLASARKAGLKVVVMLHDAIPIAHPEWSGTGAPERFRAALDGAARHADLILCPTAEAAAGIGAHAKLPAVLVAPPGVETAPPDFGALPANFRPDHASFVVLGTVEPRKNVGMALDAWDELRHILPAAAIPHLHLVGRRGWGSDALAGHFRQSAFHRSCQFQHTNLPDATVSAMLMKSRALLAPSRAEGFGFAPAEAALLGVPVIAADLPVTVEVLGDYPTYVEGHDRQAWVQAILSLSAPGNRRAPLPLPDWTGHFNLVFNHL